MTGAVMILAASFEFEKNHNSEVVVRPSDNEEIPPVRYARTGTPSRAVHHSVFLSVLAH